MQKRLEEIDCVGYDRLNKLILPGDFHISTRLIYFVWIGFINQYPGDTIIVLFPGNATDALSAAIEMKKNIHELNIKRDLKNLSPIQSGIGMHTVSLIMGITGDKERLDATTISDTVNTASR